MRTFQRKGKIIRIFIFATISIGIFYSYVLVSRLHWSVSDKITSRFKLPIKDVLQNGEQMHYEKSVKKSYVVSTSTCKIPNLNEWDDDILMLSKKCEPSDETDPKCGERLVKKWMYTQGMVRQDVDDNLMVNYSAIKESGYSTSSIHCCFHVIKRVEQSLQNYDMNADVFVKYSERCDPIPLNTISLITEEFIRVFCISNSWPFLGDVVYREYFAFAQPDGHAQNKISMWKTPAEEKVADIPPSIVILGLDTNSRLNSHRRLTKTLKVLEKMGAVEMFGYTKVGENTLPNTIAFLAGMRHEDFTDQCQQTEIDSFDDCPFLWKDFDRAGYLTSTAEESPWACGFNYLRVGFVQKPTDFYYRPFTLALMKQPRDTMWFGKCVGRYLSVEMLLNYLDDILRRGSQGAPVFIHSWLSVFSHHCINSVRFEDGAIAKFVENMDKENTIFILMSDHGDRHGPFRETTLGWYEDKLPAMWLYLPDKVRKRFPDWITNLVINARRLTSHFDLYHTLVYILKQYSPSLKVNTPKIQIGQSLLKPVQRNRTCEDAGIPSSYCACSEPEPIDVNSKNEDIQVLLTNATNTAIDYLAKVLPNECAKLSVKKIVSAKVLFIKNSSNVYILSFYTDPGDFLFEVTVKASKGKAFSVESLNDILRMNKITRKVSCVTNPVLERYCYCL